MNPVPSFIVSCIFLIYEQLRIRDFKQQLIVIVPMDIDALGSRLGGVRFYDQLLKTNHGAYIETDILSQCITDWFWPWRSDEYIIKECCRSYAKKMKISVEEFVLLDGGVFSVMPVTSIVSAVKQVVGVIKEAVKDEVTIYRLYERGSLDVVWKGHVKNHGQIDDELIGFLERKGIRSPVDEEGMKARMIKYKYANPYEAPI